MGGVSERRESLWSSGYLGIEPDRKNGVGGHGVTIKLVFTTELGTGYSREANGGWGESDGDGGSGKF